MIETIGGHHTIKQIFQHNHNWERFNHEHQGRIRPVIVEEVEKVLVCRDFSKLGFHHYRCPKCGRIEKIIPHSCKSRFCSSCGQVAVDNWINKALGEFLDVAYHHLVFTIPCELRNIFLYDRSLLNLLFKSAAQTILEWCQETAGYIPGLVLILHTFGSDLKFNPHIHVLLTEGGLNFPDKCEWIHNEYIPWNMLKARWKYHLVTYLKPKLKRLVREQRVGHGYSVLGTGSYFYSFLGSALC